MMTFEEYLNKTIDWCFFSFLLCCCCCCCCSVYFPIQNRTLARQKKRELDKLRNTHIYIYCILQRKETKRKNELKKSPMWMKERKVCVIHLQVTPLLVEQQKEYQTTHTSSFDLVFSFSLHKSSNLIDPDFTYFFLLFSLYSPLHLTLFLCAYVLLSLQILLFWIPTLWIVCLIFNNRPTNNCK